MNNPVPVLECRALAKTFSDGALHVEVLKNINLAIMPGERVAIVGASGSGKSTLLHLLGGLDAPTKGDVIVAGHNINQLAEKQRCRLRNQYLGFVYQFHHLLPEFTILENICLPLLVRGVSPKDAKARALGLMQKVNLLPRQAHKLGELSGGERQRAAIIRALGTNPACLLADEPTGNLDQHTAGLVFDMILELNKAFGTSLVIVTHDMQLASRMDRILTIRNGTLQNA